MGISAGEFIVPARFIPEIWSDRMARHFVFYGRSEFWWKHAITAYGRMTGLPLSEMYPQLFLYGEISDHRLRYQMQVGKEYDLYHKVMQFWDMHPGLADLMLPRENEHAPD